MARAPFPPFNGLPDAFRQMEGPIDRLVRLTKVQRLVCDVREDSGTPEFKEECAQALSIMADEIFHAAGELDDLWLHFHNAACDAERAEAVR